MLVLVDIAVEVSNGVLLGPRVFLTMVPFPRVSVGVRLLVVSVGVRLLVVSVGVSPKGVCVGMRGVVVAICVGKLVSVFVVFTEAVAVTNGVLLRVIVDLTMVPFPRVSVGVRLLFVAVWVSDMNPGLIVGIAAVTACARVCITEPLSSAITTVIVQMIEILYQTSLRNI